MMSTALTESACEAPYLTSSVYRTELLAFIRVTQEFQVQSVPREQRAAFDKGLSALFALRDALDDMETIATMTDRAPLLPGAAVIKSKKRSGKRRGSGKGTSLRTL